MLEAKKPWYVLPSEWSQTYTDALKQKIKGEYIWSHNPISDWTIYLFLNQDKPAFVSDGEWDAIRNIAVDRLENSCSILANNISIDKNLELLHSDKPKYFPDRKWDALIKSTSEMYVVNIKRSYMSIDAVLKMLIKPRPEKISDTAWQDYTTYLKRTYFDHIEHQVKLAENPLQTLANFNLNLLDENQKRTINYIVNWRKEAYFHDLEHQIRIAENPLQTLVNLDLDLLDEKQKDEIESIANAQAEQKEFKQIIKAILENKSIGEITPNYIDVNSWEWLRFQQLQDAINSSEQKIKIVNVVLDILNRKQTDTKYDFLSEHELNVISSLKKELQLLDDFDKTRQEFFKEKKEYEIDKEIFVTIRQKVERQLHIINNLLKDPTEIDRLESYDDTFAPGNLENLKKLSNHLKGIGTNGQANKSSTASEKQA